MTDQPTLPKRVKDGHCKRCRTVVAKGVKFCDICTPLMGKAPAMSMTLDPKKRPPYEKPPATNSQEVGS